MHRKRQSQACGGGRERAERADRRWQVREVRRWRLLATPPICGVSGMIFGAMRTPFRNLLKHAALIAVLLAAQTAALAHSDLDDSHPAQEICALCVGLANLGAANVSTPQPVVVRVLLAEPIPYVLVRSVTRGPRTQFARGPPRAS
jgi:hypothetical protein